MTYNTEKRSEILAILSQRSENAFTIDEICRILSNDGSGKSTVYRIISKMVKDGTVRKISDAHTRHTTYQYLGGKSCGEHLHLKCKDCGRLIHLDYETSLLLERKIMKSEHFAIDEGSLLFGKCESCLALEKEQRV